MVAPITILTRLVWFANTPAHVMEPDHSHLGLAIRQSISMTARVPSNWGDYPAPDWLANPYGFAKGQGPTVPGVGQ